MIDFLTIKGGKKNSLFPPDPSKCGKPMHRYQRSWENQAGMDIYKQEHRCTVRLHFFLKMAPKMKTGRQGRLLTGDEQKPHLSQVATNVCGQKGVCESFSLTSENSISGRVEGTSLSMADFSVNNPP